MSSSETETALSATPGMLCAGFDIGGTKTLGLVLDLDPSNDSVSEPRVVARQKVPRPRSGDESVEQIRDLIAGFETELGRRIDRVGVGIAGAIGDGWVKFSPNIPEIVDFPLADRLAAALDRPVVVENDAATAVWAESIFGAAVGIKNLSYVALGTGLGAAFILDGRLYTGAHGLAGEAGHMVVNSDGDTHHTGVQGPWEMRASGTGLGVLARSMASDGKTPGLIALAGTIDTIRGEHVLEALHDDEAKSEAHAVLDIFANDVSVGMLNLIYVLDPERIVLGGGLVEIGEPLRERVETAVNSTMLGGAFRPNVPVVLARLGSDAGALGAALLAR